ncbi:LolA family protein [Pseudofulvibacter geojedonensis]|uniref:Outer membrane lipoprotein carrier protein LolA n=1 Tax=Pseudofulvibacter geojedonensis TaxID=1123758 RepID=A0ABW3I1X0_9FLAO
MKKVFTFLFISMIAISGLSAQNAEKAKQYLDDVATKVSTYKNISIDFKYSLKNEAENVEQSTKGDVYLKGDKYLLNLMGVTRLYDGQKIYTISPEDEEITISNASDEEEGTITPSKMLTFYKEGYNYAWDKKLPVKGRSIQYIKLTPIDSNSEMKYVLLGIDANTKNIYNVIENGKNGAVTTLTVNSFKTNQPLSESLFTFDRSKYKDYYFNE